MKVWLTLVHPAAAAGGKRVPHRTVRAVQGHDGERARAQGRDVRV